MGFHIVHAFCFVTDPDYSAIAPQNEATHALYLVKEAKSSEFGLFSFMCAGFGIHPTNFYFWTFNVDEGPMMSVR